jgi:hypothetical protein
VLPDAVDAVSAFAVARTPGGRVVAIARATVCSRAFPHRELFRGHARFLGGPQRLRRTTMLTGVAVLPRWRGRLMRDPWSGREMTCGQAMLRRLFDYLREQGQQSVLLTTSAGSLQDYFARQGFQTIDPPFPLPGREALHVNMGLVLTKGSGNRSSAGLELWRRYFRRRERLALRGFRAPQPSGNGSGPAGHRAGASPARRALSAAG